MPQFLVVGTGAALGAAARYLLSVALGGGMIPLLIINILGSALMGYFRPGPFWGTGVLGGFTSFATFAFLTSEAHWTNCTFVANILGSLALGLAYGFAQLADAPLIHPFLALGLAGGLSTWSTLAKELGEMIKRKQWWRLSKYLFWTIGLGIVLAWRGTIWAARIYHGI